MVYLNILSQQRPRKTQKLFEKSVDRQLRNTKQFGYCNLCKKVIVFFSKQFYEIVQNVH
jgi:hypothetical protein